MIWQDQRLARPKHVGPASSRWTFQRLDEPRCGFLAKPLARSIDEQFSEGVDPVEWLDDASVVARLVLLSGRHIIAYCVSDHANGRNTIKYLHVEESFRGQQLGSTLVANAALEVPDWPTYVTLGENTRTAAPFFELYGFHNVCSDPFVLAREAAVRLARHGGR